VLSAAIADGRISMVRIVPVPVPVGEKDTTWLYATVDSTAVPSSLNLAHTRALPSSIAMRGRAGVCT
jgi:hypothetical protein